MKDNWHIFNCPNQFRLQEIEGRAYYAIGKEINGETEL